MRTQSCERSGHSMPGQCTATSLSLIPVSKTRGHRPRKNLSPATTRTTLRVATRWWYPRARAASCAQHSNTLEHARHTARPLDERRATCEHVLGGPARAQLASSASGMDAEQKVKRCSIRAELSPSRALTKGTSHRKQGHRTGVPVPRGRRPVRRQRAREGVSDGSS